MRLLRFLGLALVSGLVLLGLGPSCIIGFFVLSCDSDFDCLDDEICDFDGTCVPAFFLEEEEACGEDPGCVGNTAPAPPE